VKGEGISTLKGAVLSQRDISVIILDLTMVDMIDAAGLGALLDLREWAQENGVEFRLENPNSRVSNLFRIARLDSVFGISSIHEVCSEAAVFDAEPRFDSAAL
jgi:anti-anti-sigma factor